MKKRRSLDDFAADMVVVEPKPEPKAKPKAQAKDKPKTRRPRGGGKKQQLPTNLPEPVYDQLRKLAFDERVSMNTLILEGLELVFAARGLKGGAELK